MPLIASQTSGGSSTPAPAGSHVARCYSVVDLGTQIDDGQFGIKIQPKVRITWELPTELHVFKEEKGEEPFVVGKEYTLNLGEKSNLRKDLESWRGRPFTEKELEGFDVSKLIGAPCILNVVHKTGTKGVNARIAGISPLLKGMQCPPAVLPTICYDVTMGRNEVYAKIPEWLRKKIDLCEDWKKKSAEPEVEPEHEPDYESESDSTELHSSNVPF